MDSEKLKTLAALIAERDAVSARIADLTGGPAQIGHLGEFIAAELFDIAPNRSARHKGFDGRFQRGPLAGRTVDVEWYAVHEGILSLRRTELPEFHLVLAGPASSPTSLRTFPRPWLIEAVYLFEARPLVDRLVAAGRDRIGVAMALSNAEWQSAEIFPRASNATLRLSPSQRTALSMFAGVKA